MFSKVLLIILENFFDLQEFSEHRVYAHWNGPEDLNLKLVEA
jgi:hypothetical protein